MTKTRFAILAVVCVVLLSVCEENNLPVEDDSSPGWSPEYYPQGSGEVVENVPVTSISPFAGGAVQKVPYKNGENVFIELKGLKGHSVYLVRVNTSGKSVEAVDAGDIVSYSRPRYSVAPEAVHAAKSEAGEAVYNVSDDRNGQTITRYDPVGLNDAIYDAIKSGKLRREEPSKVVNNSQLRLSSNMNISAQIYNPGAPRDFHVQKNDGNSEYKTISTTLRAKGDRCNIWVADDNYDDDSPPNNSDNKITSAQAQAMADKFDEIYDKETAIFGYELGGEPGGNGGIDGDLLIQILVYDIFDDYSRNQKSGVLGYFFSGDEFSQAALNNSGNGHLKSNEAEMFYIDAHFTDIDENVIYSTLVHEFQHMIHYNQKTGRSADGKTTSAVWFNEMLSMLAEDLIDPLIHIDTSKLAHPVRARMPESLRNYNYADPTKWLSESDVLISYANAYALGAYLVRNFGGVNFIRELMTNSYVDIASIDAALSTAANSNVEINSFTKALSRFGEALLFNMDADNRPAGVLSFNNTVSSTIDGTTYEFNGFDVNDGNLLKGPVVWNTSKTYALHPRTLIIQTNKSWKNITGDFSVTLRPPTVSGVDMYIIVR